MARTQAKILCSIWTNPDFVALTSDAQRLYFLVLSQPRLNLAGCIDLMPERWARLCSGWTVDDVMRALGELVEAEFVAVDGDELVVRTFGQHDLAHGAVNSNLVKGMWSAWEAISSPFLRMVVVDNMPDRLWDMKGVTAPEKALAGRLRPRPEPRSEPEFEPRSEPRFSDSAPPRPETAPDQGEQPQSEPRFEPQSEPSVSRLLTPVTSSSLRTTPVPEPPERSHDDEPAAAPDLEQTIRRTAALIGRTIAAQRPGTVNPTGYATGVTRQILDPNGDGIDRTRIERLLTDGQTPETIAATWATTTDPLLAVLDGPNTEPAAPRPHPPAFTGHHQPPRNDQLNTTGIAAARAAIRGTAHQPPPAGQPHTNQE